MRLSLSGDLNLRGRVLEATLRCIARWGVTKTSLDDIAREAGCSRASVYRAFPGGKDALLQAVVAAEVAAFFEALNSRLLEASTLRELLVAGVGEALERLNGHEALAFLAEYEPDRLSLIPAPSGLARVLPPAVTFTSAHLRRFLPEAAADEAAEWVARLVLSYAMCAPLVAPSGGTYAARLVDAVLLPAIGSAATGPPCAAELS